jgi:hypothetical protein
VPELPRLRPRRFAAACLLWSLLAVVVQAAGFAPSETVFPAGARAWLSISDARGLRERFDASPYGQMAADPALKGFIDSLREQIRTGGGRRLEKLELKLEDFEGLAGGEIAVAAIEGAEGKLSTVVLVDTSGHEAEAKALVERITARLVERKAQTVAITGAPPELTVYQLPDDPQDDRVAKGRRVAVAQGAQAIVVGDDAVQVGQAFEVLAKGREDSLATAPAFTAVMKPCRDAVPAAAPVVRWFVDPIAFAKAFQVTNPPLEKRKGPDYVSILSRQGFDAVKGAGGVVVMQEGNHTLRHHTMIHAPPLPGREPQAPDCYALAARMLRFPNAEGVTPPAWVPRGASGWTALQWDIPAAFAAAETLVDEVVGDKGVYDDVIASLKEDPDGPQIDVEKDLIAGLGRRVAVFSDSVEPLGTDSERLVIALEAVDEPRIAATVAKVMNADSDMRRVEIGGHTAWELIDHSAEVPKLDVDFGGAGPPPIAAAPQHDVDDSAHRRRARLKEREEKLLPHSTVTVAFGHLLIASHRDVLEKLLASADAADGLAAAADYTALASELERLLPGGKALVSFGRDDEAVRPAYELLRQGSMPKSKSLFGQLLNAVLGDGKPGTVREQKVDGSSLPDFELVRRYFGTSGTVMQSRPDGWYVLGVGLPRATNGSEVARKPEPQVK